MSNQIDAFLTKWKSKSASDDDKKDTKEHEKKETKAEEKKEEAKKKEEKEKEKKASVSYGDSDIQHFYALAEQTLDEDKKSLIKTASMVEAISIKNNLDLTRQMVSLGIQDAFGMKSAASAQSVEEAAPGVMDYLRSLGRKTRGAVTAPVRAIGRQTEAYGAGRSEAGEALLNRGYANQASAAGYTDLANDTAYSIDPFNHQQYRELAAEDADLASKQMTVGQRQINSGNKIQGYGQSIQNNAGLITGVGAGLAGLGAGGIAMQVLKNKALRDKALRDAEVLAAQQATQAASDQMTQQGVMGTLNHAGQAMQQFGQDVVGSMRSGLNSALNYASNNPGQMAALGAGGAGLAAGAYYMNQKESSMNKAQEFSDTVYNSLFQENLHKVASDWERAMINTGNVR